MTTLANLDHDGRWFAGQLLAAFAPPPDIAPSVWAERNLVLTSDFAAEPGNYSLDRTPWCRAPLDDAADPSVEVVAIGGASQTGKSQLSLAVASYFAAVSPCSIMHITPTDGLSETFSARIDSMIHSSAALREKFVQARRTRALANKHTKSFDGGVLVLASAASPTDLSSRPVKVAIADEIDRMGVIRKEGDPLALIHARQQTFPSRKLYAISTPTVAGFSRIESMMAEARYHEWHARCPHCGDLHHLVWEGVKWEPGKPETAVYEAPCCGSIWSDVDRWRAGAGGEWIVVHDGKAGWKSYRFNGLVSPWVRLAELASMFEAAKGLASRLQPIWNLKLGLPYEADIGEGASAEVVAELAEPFSTAIMPPRAVLLTAGVDVQASWLAISVVAWGDGDEGWVLGWHEIPGDPLDPKTWAAAEAVLLQKWRHPSGEEFGIEAAAVDSGFQSQAVYEFSAKQRARGRRWYSSKGMAGQRPIWTRGADVHASMSKIFIVGVDGAKDQIAAGLMQATDGSGRLHVPRSIIDEVPHWTSWATAEETITRELPSGPRREWRLKKGVKRNEVFDTLVLALAARYSGNFDVERRVTSLATVGVVKQKQTSIADLAARAAALSH